MDRRSTRRTVLAASALLAVTVLAESSAGAAAPTRPAARRSPVGVAAARPAPPGAGPAAARTGAARRAPTEPGSRRTATSAAGARGDSAPLVAAPAVGATPAGPFRARAAGDPVDADPGPQVVYRQGPSRGPDPVPPPDDTPSPEMPAGSLFGAGSVWQTAVAGAPVALTSPLEIANLVGHVVDRYGGVAAFNAHDYATTFWTATASTPRLDVGFDNCQGKTSVPAGLLGAGGQFSAVPIPAGAFASTGTDRTLSVYSPSTDQLWEFWEAEHTPAGWTACWGGRIDHVSTSPGYFGGGFGSSATGLSVSGGTLTLADVRAGVANHALSLEIPSPAIFTNVSWPAQRSDGTDASPAAIPEGTRLRLDPTLDVASYPGLTPIARVVARAAQDYGFLVTDTSGAVSVSAESGAPDLAATGVDPWTSLEQGVPDYAILRGFPWNRLQAMPKDWGKP